MAFTEDLSVFFDTDEFAVTATLAGGATLDVIFDRAHIQALGGDISGTGPIALARSADVSTFVAHTTTLTIAGVTYTVLDLQPDGTGLTLLVLEAA